MFANGSVALLLCSMCLSSATNTIQRIFVIEDDHSTISLYMGGKIRDNLWLVNMKLGDDGWAKPDPNSLKYEVIDQTSEIYWVAQLKPLHAQRIALHVGSEASKVGVTESEWLRLVHQKSS